MKTLNLKITVVFFLLIIISCLTGCKKEEEKTTYQIINNYQKLSDNLITYLTEDDPGLLQYLDGTLHEVIVYCYIGSDIVRTDNLGTISPKGGKSDITEVESDYEKVKVSFLLFPSNLTVNLPAHLHRFHPVTITILEKGINNSITIDGTVIISNSD